MLSDYKLCNSHALSFDRSWKWETLSRTSIFQKRTSSTLVVGEIVVARPLVKLQFVFKNKNSNANYTLHWSVVWSLWASGWSLWTVTRCACVRLRAWHLSVRPAGSLQTTCHRPSAASSPLFVFVFSFLFVFLFVFARSLQTPCHRPLAASSPLCWSIVTWSSGSCWKHQFAENSCWPCITTLVLIFWKSGCYLHLSLLPQQKWKYYGKAEGDKDVDWSLSLTLCC